MRWCQIIILNLAFYSATSQELLFENYASDQGLSQNSCYSIAQDSDGFMWFGTQDGLNRYDGQQFRTFLPQSSMGRKLPSNYISSLYFDQTKNLLWVGTIGGACLYDTKRDSLVSIVEIFPYAAILATVPIKKIVSFRPNEYWIITFNRGLFQLNTSNNKVNSYFTEPTNRSKVNSIVLHEGKLIVAALQRLYTLVPQTNTSSYQVLPLLEDYPFPEIKELFSYHDDLWIGTLTDGCLYIRNSVDETKTVSRFEKGSGGIGCFTTDANDNLWIGTRGNGIIQYNPFTQVTQRSSHDRYKNNSLGKDFVLSLFRDRQGLIWCGLSGSGVSKYDPLKYQFRTVSNEPVKRNSLPDNMVFDIFKCSDGTYYVGTQIKGLSEWNPTTNEFKTYSESSKFGPINNTIYDMAEDHAGNVWIASWGGLIELNKKTKRLSFNKENNLLTAKKLYAIHKLKNADSLFIAGENGPVFFSLKEKMWKSCPENLMQSNAFIGRYIFEDSNEILWICTVGGGLVRYDFRNNNLTTIEEIKKYSIYARHLLLDGTKFWLATDNGIVVYDYLQQKVVRHIPLLANNGSNVCYAIAKDKKGFFWASSNTGLYRIDPDNFSHQNYDHRNGLSFLEYNTACILKEPDGTLIFGGVGGITQFNPLLLKENGFSPAPLLTAIMVNDQIIQFDSAVSKVKRVSLAHNQNFIKLYFAVNNFSIENKNLFAFRLKGLSDSWTNSDNRNFANYTSLPPGDYVFELKSANSDGKFSSTVSTLDISISPPWWQTWWFRLSALLAIAGIVTILVRRRIAVIRNEAELKHRMAETEMMALRAQMNPHFIFNCINS
ncbi:MAG: hypothetical protein H7Y31_17510, partial [Chitinophagaceae bacterium]|nr:hypothetical protein [Chitinophagaceae bacterium]